MNESIKVNMIMLPEEAVNQILNDQKLILERLDQKQEENFAESYLDSKQIPKLLNISLKTWQNYRDKRKIPFIQFGSKIWVKRIDLEAFLDKHYITNKKNKTA